MLCLELSTFARWSQARGLPDLSCSHIGTGFEADFSILPAETKLKTDPFRFSGIQFESSMVPPSLGIASFDGNVAYRFDNSLRVHFQISAATIELVVMSGPAVSHVELSCVEGYLQFIRMES